MIVGIKSPRHGLGQTVVSAIIAGSLSTMQQRTVCLTHTNVQDHTLARYNGVTLNESGIDRSMSIISSILNTNQLDEEKLLNYMYPVNDVLKIFDTITTISDMEFNASYIKLLEEMGSPNSSFNDVVIDLDSGLESDILKQVTPKLDVIMIPITCNKDNIKYALELRAYFEYLVSRNRKKPKIHFILNQYSSDIIKSSKIASELGIVDAELKTISQYKAMTSLLNANKLGNKLTYLLESSDSDDISLRESMFSLANIILGREFRTKQQILREEE